VEQARNQQNRYVRTAQQMEKDHEAAMLRSRSWTYKAIAEHFELATHSAAVKMVQRAIADIPRQATEELVAIEVAKIDYAERKALEVLERRHVVVSQGGKIVYDGEEQLQDDGPILQAIDRLVRLGERRARLLGLNAPTNVRLEVVNYDADTLDAELEEFKRAFGEGSGDPEALLDAEEGETRATTA
jgi:hypothetical protein